MEQDTTSIFDILIWSGATISVLGLLGLIWCIIRVSRARRANLPEDDMRAVLKSVIPLNLASLLISALGLMLVVVGIFLG